MFRYIGLFREPMPSFRICSAPIAKISEFSFRRTQEANLITSGQLRAARTMLRLDQQQFATLVHISVSAVQRLERSRGPLKASPEFLQAIRIALDAAGIELIDSGPYSGQGGPGLRLKGDVMVQVAGEPELSEAAEARLTVVA